MSSIYGLIGIYVILWINICSSTTSELEVCAPQLGCVRGKYMPGYKTDNFIAFLGIPFALPPVNELRFSNPKSYPKLEGVYEAIEQKADCIQKNYLLPNPTVMGEEDCLHLNVYKPLNAKSSAPLPVIVYIYGGGWFSGTSSPLVHGPEYFMDTKEVVFVIINYRLGPLGFLSTNDRNMPGNLGLKDQNLALRWVKNNIRAFGGDPDKVTIMGQSAGAVSAHMHMLSKQSEGLFHGVISLSGTANVPFAITENPLQQARQLAKFCNISNADNLSSVKLVRALRNIDARTLINAGDGFKYWDVDHLTNFRPIVESADISDAFLTKLPDKLLQTAQYSPVPWMINFVPNEGSVRGVAILENPKLLAEFNKTFDNMLEQFLDLPSKFDAQRRHGIMSFVSNSYFGKKHNFYDNNKLGLLDVISDRGFIAPIVNAVHHYINTVDTNKYPLYINKFNYKGPYSFATLFAGGVPSRNYGVGHCDELIYLFRMPAIFPDFNKNSIDAEVVQSFVGSIINFAKNHNPSKSGALKSCNKKLLTRLSTNFCDIEEVTNSDIGSFKVRVSSSFNITRINAWNDLLGN